MCGISGIVDKKNGKISKKEIKKINDLIKHRGPDDEGFFFKNNFAIAHRRLSILDLSNDGHQPMHYLEKFVITYNGEIYNYIELKEQLKKNNYKFKSNTDTEVILASYDMWGENCVNKFNGMWAFTIYDKEKDILFCSRDRFGIKPFYYTETDQKFIFGSEIKQLVKFHDNLKFNKNILIDYVVTKIEDHTNETFFEKIFKLEQSHNLVYDLKKNTFKIKKYYSINFKQNSENLLKSIQNYKKELSRAINFRLRSDVKVGTCLSGGLDSSSIAAIAAKQYNLKSNHNFTAIHAKSSEINTDESEFAKLVAKFNKLDLTIIEPTKSDFKENIDEVVYTQEEPFGDPSIFMQYFVMKKAKELGCTVMLDGQGGDETLLGYQKYYPSIYIEVFRKFGFLKALKEVKNSNKNNQNMSPLWICKYIIGSLFASLRKLENKSHTKFLKPYENKFNFFNKLAKYYLNIKKLQEYEIKCTNLPILLRYEDKNSMRHSIEARLPFLDYITLEYALNLNVLYKIKNGWSKYILRRCVETYLPNKVVWRKNKIGFNAPDNTWINEIDKYIKPQIKKSKILAEICYLDKLLDQIDKSDVKLKWRIYNIAIWEKVYNVQT